MADVADVVDTLVGICGALLYANGTGASSASVCGVDAYVFAGWPVPQQFEKAAANKRCMISVYPWTGERNTTRYLQRWRQTSINTPTLVLTITGQTVLIGGTVPPLAADNPHNVCVFVNGHPYVYGVQPTDTLSTIMAALSALIGVDVPGTINVAATLVFPTGARIGACRVGVTGTGSVELKRQEKQFHIIIWADSPQHRTALAKVLDPGLCKLTFINLPDLTGGRIRYHGNTETDAGMKQLLYRRDLIYTVEYGTIDSETYTQVTQFVVTLGVPGPPQSWSADSTVVTMDSEVFTADAQPNPNTVVFYD